MGCTHAYSKTFTGWFEGIHLELVTAVLCAIRQVACMDLKSKTGVEKASSEYRPY